MKKLILALVPLSIFASSVSLEDADGFVRRWKGSVEDFDKSEIVRTIAVTNEGSVAYYMALRKSGSAVFISPDTDVYPILAQSCGISDGEGNVTAPASHPIWDMVLGGATTSVMKASAPMKLSAAKKLSSTDERQVNRGRWSAFSGRLGAYVPVSGDEIGGPEKVLSGFEDNGPLTHWSQTTAVRGFTGTVPLYNYYMHTSSKGGAGASGLDITEASDVEQFPCGCVATALAAAAQYLQFTGIKDDAQYANGVSIETNRYDYTKTRSVVKSLVNGVYDWSILPSNYGGQAPAATSDESFPAAARELIGRVTYNYGIAIRMGYGYKSSGTSDILYPDQTGSAGYGFLDFTYATRDHAHVNRNGRLGGRSPSASVVAKVIEAAVRMNEPVIMAVRGSSGGHCILGVGTRGSGYGQYLKVFMGWGGVGDTWFYGGGTSIGSTFTTVDSIDVLGGEGHPTTFMCADFLGCDTGMGTKVYDGLKVSSSSTTVVVTNSSSTKVYIGFVHPYYSETGSGPSTLSGSVTFSMDPFVVSGVTLTPNSESKSMSTTYMYNNSPGYGRYVYLGRSTGSIFLDMSFSLSAAGSKSYGFPHGTPESLSDFMYGAFTNNVPVVIISGRDGTLDPVVSEFKNGRSAELLSGCYVYFIDTTSETRPGVIDWQNSYMVVDPFGGMREDFWDSESAYRLSYGTFTDPDEIYSVISEGKSKFATLPAYRDNAYGLKWYQHPKIDTNPYYIPAGTTSLDLNSVRSQGYTSIHATGLTTMTRSNASYQDSTVRYVDFSQCPCTSSSSQLLRNFKALITTDGLPSGFTSVPNYCFADCTALERIDALPSGVTTLNQGAFYGCTSLKSADLPESVRTIGQNCFTNCKNLDNTDGIGKVTSIGSYAFSMSSVGYDGNHAFAITEWPISSVPGYMFQNRNGISSVANLPTNVTSFANYAFSGVHGITDVVIPPSVKSFGSYCFSSMYQVKTMDLLGTSGDFSIGQNAFYQTGTHNDSCIITFHCTKAELQAKTNYPFTPNTGYGMVFRCTDGDINL